MVVTVRPTVAPARAATDWHSTGRQLVFKASDLLVAALTNEGVDRIFGIPGEENLDVVESIRKSTIQLILTRHEQAAAFMAATHGRLTGKPGVCLTTLGPGALNLSTGAAYALLGAMPMIMITGQKGILSSRQARFQMVDIVAAMKPLTKLSRQIVSPLMIPTLVRDAFRVAEEERPGPVHLELPEDIAAEKCEEVALIPPHPLELPLASAEALDRAAQMIVHAEYPLLMLGGVTPAVDFGPRPIRAAHTNSLLHDADG
jgi:acetolactate synthase-1/2/3 large subunit